MHLRCVLGLSGCLAMVESLWMQTRGLWFYFHKITADLSRYERLARLMYCSEIKMSENDDAECLLQGLYSWIHNF